jgi:hypothetical protein
LAQPAVGEYRVHDEAAARADQRWQMNSPQGWSKLFEDPVNGRKLITLLDAGNYIAALPRKEAEGDTGRPRLKLSSWQQKIAGR